MPYYSPTLMSSSMLLVALSSLGDGAPSLICAVAGLFGGCISQLLTVDDRRPTRKVLIGNLLISSVLGFGAFVGMGDLSNETILASIVAGSTGWVGWTALVKTYLPKWLHADEDKADEHK